MTWNNCFILDFGGPFPAVEISDGVTTYCRSLADGESFVDAVAEFWASYDFNGVTVPADWKGTMNVDFYDAALYQARAAAKADDTGETTHGPIPFPVRSECPNNGT